MIIAVLFFLGLSLGSFVNALVWRVHQQELPVKKRAGSKAELSIMTGRSMCPNCKHTLGVFDLLPVISWVALRGRCRYCKDAIGWQYPTVELITAVLFVLSYAYWPYGLTESLDFAVFVLWLVSLVGLVALTVYDIRWMLLPNRIVFSITGLATLMVLLRAISDPNPLTIFLQSLGGLAIAGGIFYVLFQISDGKWIGGGDVKLGFALGLLLGTPALAFLMLFASSLIGLLFAIPSLMTEQSNKSRQIPFGPSLMSATFVCILFGQRIIDWYSAQFLYL